MDRTILNKVINNIDTVDLAYYFRAERNMTYKQAMKEVSKIAQFLNTDFIYPISTARAFSDFYFIQTKFC